MKAFVWGRIDIHRITFTQDAVGGMIENATPVLQNARAVVRQSNRFEGVLGGKIGVSNELVFFIRFPRLFTLLEQDYIIYDGCCYDISSVVEVNTQIGGRYGAEVRATLRK